MQVKKYFQKKVGLFSTSDVRYVGELYTVDPAEQSIALKHVKCLGTEGRRTGDQAISESDCQYEFIIFRAVNCREIYLDLGNGQRRDLTDELLMPLRTGKQQQPSQRQPRPQQRQQDMEYQDAPKRKVGYQSRSAQQGQQYYEQQGGGYGGGYRRGQQQYRRGYDDYPPQQYRRPQYDAYYDAPPPSNGYYSRGYRQRAPQYYNAPYYEQSGGYGGQYNGYRRYRQQQPQQRGQYRQQQRGYGGGNRGGYRSQNRQQQQGKGSQAGTGAYLDSARLRGDEIDIKDQQDFDFGAAKDEFDLNDAEKNAAHGLIVGKKMEKGAKDVDDEETKAIDNNANGDEEDSKDKSVSKEVKYDAAKSFFDGLQTETKKSKPRQDMQTQKEVDTSTFGTIAGQYQSRHMQQKRQYRRNNNRNNYNNQRGNNYNRPRPQQQQQTTQSNGYSGGNRWVRK